MRLSETDIVGIMVQYSTDCISPTTFALPTYLFKKVAHEIVLEESTRELEARASCPRCMK